MRPGDKPANHLNTAIMERYRTEMKKFYYDPTKYKTYLEQLGITYPTVRTTAKVVAVERRVIRFEVAAFDGERKIGEGRHARGLVNVESFNKRLGAK